MIRCEEILRELSDYIDEDVTPQLRNQIQEHLRGCRNCTVLVDTIRKTLILVSNHYVLELPQGVSERLMARLGFP